MRPLKDADRRRDVYLDLTQRRALIAKAPPDLAVFMSALSLVPLRPGAMAALVAGNFDKRLSTLTIGTDKHGQDRKITLPPATAAFFAEQGKNKLPTAPLLARGDGSAWNKDAWKYPFKDAVIAAELPYAATAYALRHSTITDLIALHKLDTLTVAQLSGTSLLMIEKHYGHLLREHAAKALASLTL
jgi:integrase